MSSLVDSPAFATVMGMAGASVAGLGTLIYRLTTKVGEIAEKADEISADVTEIKNDTNIVRWSDIARIRRGRKWRVY